jgi:deoxyadenosine/deoxycytidine kinase
MPRIFSIEGNIGAGKTTIIEQLMKSFEGNKNIIFLREPVDLWQKIVDSNGEDILTKFYRDTPKYAFAFQIMAYTTRLAMLRNAIRENPYCHAIVCERSLEADCNVFAKMLFDDTMIEDINYSIYLQLYEACKREFTVDGIIYIDADADVCHKRVSTRARDGEGGISLEYLLKCKKYHDEWLETSTTCEILRIDANTDVCYDFENPEDKGIQWISNINSFIDTFGIV